MALWLYSLHVLVYMLIYPFIA